MSERTIRETIEKGPTMLNRLRSTILAVCAASLVALAAPAVAQEAATTQQAAPTFSESEIEAVAGVYVEILDIQNEYVPKIEAAQSPDEAQQLQQEAAEKSMKTIEDYEGVTPELYNEVMTAAQQSPEVGDRLLIKVREIQGDDEGT